MSIRVAAGLLALAGWSQCATYLWKAFGWAKWDIPGGFAIFVGYYTNWAMFLTGAACAYVALSKSGRRTPWLTTLALIATITMMLGYWTAVTWSEYRANPIYHQAAHGPVPLALLLFWLTCIRHGTLRFRDAFIWPIVPIVYTLWMLLYGYLAGYYPYWQLDPGRMGWRHIGIDIIKISVATYAGGLALVWLDRRLAAAAGLPERWARLRSADRRADVPASSSVRNGLEPIEP